MSSTTTATTTTTIPLAYRDRPYPSWLTERLPVKNCTYIELAGESKLYESIGNYIIKHTKQSYRIFPDENSSPATRLLERLARMARNGEKLEIDNELKGEEEEKGKTYVTLGLGFHEFVFEEGNKTKMYALHQTIAKPKGCMSGDISFHCSLVVFVEGRGNIDILRKFCDSVLSKSEEKNDPIYIKIYRWEGRRHYWKHTGRRIARDINTVVLPHESIQKITKDIDRFLDEKSVEWYFRHGIPYKRSYLFYGVPGSGKSSLLQALAAKYQRNLCFLQPTDSEMTDDSFKTCIQNAPSGSIIILEDIDALFNKDRSKKHQNCPLTFTGLLNGLDGVGNPDGQIFILTTNFVERLDNALIRSGRVDIHVHFPHATDEQLIKIFSLFYPKASNELSTQFVTNIRQCFPKGIAMATVQQHFIINMGAKAEDVVERVLKLQERIDVTEQLNEKSKTEEEKKKEKENKEKRRKRRKRSQTKYLKIKIKIKKITTPSL